MTNPGSPRNYKFSLPPPMSQAQKNRKMINSYQQSPRRFVKSRKSNRRNSSKNLLDVQQSTRFNERVILNDAEMTVLSVSRGDSMEGNYKERDCTTRRFRHKEKENGSQFAMYTEQATDRKIQEPKKFNNYKKTTHRKVKEWDECNICTSFTMRTNDIL